MAIRGRGQAQVRAFFVSTRSVWRIVLEKRGPMATNSRSRSMSSRMTIDSGDCATAACFEQARAAICAQARHG